jgi:hypothetical protein
MPTGRHSEYRGIIPNALLRRYWEEEQVVLVFEEDIGNAGQNLTRDGLRDYADQYVNQTIGTNQSRANEYFFGALDLDYAEADERPRIFQVEKEGNLITVACIPIKRNVNVQTTVRLGEAMIAADPQKVTVNGRGGSSQLMLTAPDLILTGKGQNTHYPGGGPGGVPVPVPKSYYNTKVPTIAKTQSVDVYVLDSWYPMEMNPQPEHQAMPYLNLINVDRVLSSNSPLRKSWEWRGQFDVGTAQDPPKKPYNHLWYDHGPFVVDIIYHLAPNANIIAMETLNRYNCGTIEWLRYVLQRVRAQIDASTADYHLVNMSFAFDLPDKCVFRETIAEFNTLLENRVDINPNVIQEVQDTIDFVVQTQALSYATRLQTLLDFLLATVYTANNTLVIAAAGNESVNEIVPIDPYFPAKLPRIKGVGAYDWDDVAGNLIRASYSNIADIPDSEFVLTTAQELALYGGISFYGGGMRDYDDLAVLNGKHAIYVTDRGVVGPYCNNDFSFLKEYIQDGVIKGAEVVTRKAGGGFTITPLTAIEISNLIPATFSNTPNTYAMWSGTSFAVARATGKIAARILQGDDLPDAVANATQLSIGDL